MTSFSFNLDQNLDIDCIAKKKIMQADKDLFGDDCDGPSGGGGKGGASGGGGGGGGGSEPDSDSDEENVETPDAIRRRAERDAFKLREVFLSRQMETLPATLIR